MRAAVCIFMVASLTACQASPRPHGIDPPTTGLPDIGVAYVVTVWCDVPLPLGSTWWAFDRPAAWPPPMSDGSPDWWPWKSVSSPYEVPATVTLLSADEAIFRAASDGSELRLTRYSRPPADPGGCL